MRKDLMKKLLFVLFLACCLLNGCGTENNKPAAGAGGDYYADFMAVDAAADGWYQITGQVHVEDALPLVYLQAQAETTLNLELTFNSAQGDIRLDYVKPDGEVLPLCGNAVTDITTPTTSTVPLTLLAGDSYLQWTATADAAATADFELTISKPDGVDIAMRSPMEDEKWWELKKSLPEINPSLDGQSQGVNNRPLVLQAGERFEFADPSPQEACTLGLLVWLAEPTGDLQLVYVQPDGVDKVLWSSEGQEEWLINLEINLLPGGGRLEWRSENGCECTMYFLIERSEEAGVIGFRA